MPYVAKPKPCYMDQFEFYKVIDGRKVYRGNGRLYSWDELHGEIEVLAFFSIHEMQSVQTRRPRAHRRCQIPVQNKDRYNRQAAVDNRDNPSNAGGKLGRETIR